MTAVLLSVSGETSQLPALYLLEALAHWVYNRLLE